MATQDQSIKGQTNIQIPEPIRYPTPMRPPVLTQIKADFQLSQESCNKPSSQMSEMTETNKLLCYAIIRGLNASISNQPMRGWDTK